MLTMAGPHRALASGVAEAGGHGVDWGRGGGTWGGLGSDRLPHRENGHINTQPSEPPAGSTKNVELNETQPDRTGRGWTWGEVTRINMDMDGTALP